MKSILSILLLATVAMADTTNLFVYVKSTGAKVHADTTMVINPATISADGKTFKDGPLNLDCGICANTTKNYWQYTNTNQLTGVVDILPADFVAQQQAAAQITPAMQALMDAVNKRLTTNKITLAEITAATKSNITATATAGGSAE